MYNEFEHKEDTVTGAEEILNEKKPKKKRKIFGLIKLTAGAMVFGLVAAASFEGYYALTRPETEEVKEDNLKVTEVSQEGTADGEAVTADLSSGKMVSDVSDVVEKVMPSIVAINSTINVTSYDFFGRGYTEQTEGSGSGIIVGNNGSDMLIVTNNHVVDGADTVEIVFADDSTASAVIKGTDANADLAVLSVDLSKLTQETINSIKVATLGDSDALEAGDMVIAIGNALGYGQSVTVGYVSALNREVTIEDLTLTLIQTDAAINPGNSGGALINTNGEIIGINSAKIMDSNEESVEGMGYAIPITSAIPMINELIDRQLVAENEQGFLGINVTTAQNVTDAIAERFGMPIGVYVNEVVGASPAEEAGLKQSDIITGIDGVTVKTIDELKEILSYKKAGQTINITVQVKENGEYVEKTLEVTLASK
ncbi:MAG: trypsin-like peptidase domain-containing protein [Mobilitalea sp.]